MRLSWYGMYGGTVSMWVERSSGGFGWSGEWAKMLQRGLPLGGLGRHC